MAEGNKDIVLSIRGMSKSFGRNKVLKHIDMDVPRGSIMGLMGENGAGKSTMMKCLFGTYQKDEGTIILDGKEISFTGPKDALENGVAMVHQELNQCLERNVIDNLFLGRYPKTSLGVIDEGRMKKEASDLFRKLGITVDLSQPMKKMSVSKRQMCEIAKAISYNSKVIVLDEPTSSLTAPEVEKLFKMMRQLREQGISLIYISHKMDEIFEICDQVSVLRDGALVMTKNCSDTNMNELISAMVGRSLDNRFPPVDNTPGDVILRVEHLSTKYAPKLQDITFDVKKGEIFGLLGPSGAGKTTFLNILTGQIQADSGKGLIFGQNIREFTAQMYTRIGMLLDNCGLYARLSGYQNLKIMSIIYGLSDDEIIEVLKEVELLADKDKAVFRMSKGMQQRLAFAKAILNKPEILFLDEPTTGLDPVTTGYIHNMIKKLAEKGTTIILTTHNMDEAAKLCDNVGMLYEGKIVEYGNPQELCYRYRVENLFRVISNDDEEIYIENNESGRKKAAEMLVHNEIKSIHTVETTLQTIFVKLTGKELENESSSY